MSRSGFFFQCADSFPLSSHRKVSVLSASSYCALALLLLVISPGRLSYAQAPTPVPVLTWRYDLTHAGQNTDETLLTPANVNGASFGKLFSLGVDSTTYAQPLYVPALKMNDGLVHNVLFVATGNDSVYAFDADSNGGANAKPIWKITLLDSAHGAGAGATVIPWQDTGSPDIGLIGVTGTPTIDPATDTIYLVAATKENGIYHSRLHAINIIDGTERPNSPVEVKATVAGTGNGSSGGQLSFDPLWQNQRTALNFYNGYVYFGYAAHGDQGNWHGWLFAYDGTTLQQTAALCLSPNGAGAGIWGSGAGLPIDTATGKMFVVTGNGTRSNIPPFASTSEMGESVIAFDVTNGQLKPLDAFTPYNYQQLNNGDWDLGAGGLLMIDNAGPNPHMLIAAGKEGRILVLNRDNLGGFVGASAGSSTNALQDIPGLVPQAVGFWSTGAYWNGNVYLWAKNNVPMLFKLTNGVLGTQPASKSTKTAAYPAPSFSVSSNGNQDGIAWAVRTDLFNSYGPGVLYAWDANDLTKLLYESDANPQRDSAGPGNKFAIPIVTNGKVYVPGNGQLDVYGLFNGAPVAAAPVITPNGGTFSAEQNVQLSSATGSATIYYTLDGSTPTPSSKQYTAPITLSSNTTLKAIASAAGFVQSGVTSATFTFLGQTPAPTITPPGGTYKAAQTVTITDSDQAANIYYTTDGSAPTAASTRYSGPITVAVSETINAIAIDSSLQDSPVSTEAYVIENSGATVDFSGGFAVPTGLTLNGSAVTSNDTRLQLTDGNLNESGSVFWNTPTNVQAFTTTFEFQLSNTNGGNGFTFAIQNTGPTALGANASGLGYQGIQKSVAVKFNFYDVSGSGSDSIGLYTNGQAPTVPAIDISPSGIQLGSGDGIQANITYDGTTLTLNLLDMVTKKTYTTSWPIDIPATVAGNTAYVGFTGSTSAVSSSQKLLTWMYATQAVPPAFNPAAGTYSATQSVTLSSKTADAAIYYTTDGTTPTAASTPYTGPITVKDSQTLEAIAISPTNGSSVVANAAYVIQNTQAPANFSLAATPVADVAPGSASTSTITITPANGFTGLVALTCAVSGGPAGAVSAPTCNISQPQPITSTQPATVTLTVTAAQNVTAGSYSIAVTGTSQSLTSSVAVPVTVTGPTATPQFALSGSPISIASPGANGSSVITITPSGGFTGNVQLSCLVNGGPVGATDVPTCSLTQPTAVTDTQSVTGTLSITTTANTTPGTYSANITGVSGTLSETTSIAITVSGPPATPSFSLTGAPVSISSPGMSGASAITIIPAGGFTGTVALSCSITGPSGVTAVPTCTIDQSTAISGTAAGTATLTVSTSATTTPGAYVAAVTATSGALTQSANVSITVNGTGGSSSFSLSGSAVTMTVGENATSTITITPANGFTGTVSLTCSMSSTPAQVASPPSCSVAQPAAITGAQSVTATLTIHTVQSAQVVGNPLKRALGLGGGGTLALLLFCLPIRRRKWQTFFGLLLLLMLGAISTGCGGTKNLTVGKNGTTTGTYAINVTGTSGTQQASTTIPVTIQP